ARTVGLSPCGVQKNFTRFVGTLRVEQRDSFIQTGFKQRRIVAGSLTEEFQCLRGPSAIHLRNAEVVGSNGGGATRNTAGKTAGTRAKNKQEAEYQQRDRDRV